MPVWRVVLLVALATLAWACTSDGAAGYVGKPCTTNDDCGFSVGSGGAGCAYLMADGCQAKGVCEAMSVCTGDQIGLCACGGGAAQVFCGASPQGYADQPVLGLATVADPTCGVDSGVGGDRGDACAGWDAANDGANGGC
jgi:hypothetical protein